MKRIWWWLVDAWCAWTRSCAEAPGPVYRGQPGYSRRIDRDGDGVACE